MLSARSWRDRRWVPASTPPNYNFHGGTEGDNDFTGQATLGNDVFCGFGGVDRITTLDAGDIFLAGAGSDLQVQDNNGTIYGGEGDDDVLRNNGTFYGELGNDFVGNNSGTFYGGEGDDGVNINSLTGTFYGGEGNDSVVDNAGTFNGGPGDDTVGTGNPPVDGSP